MCIDDGRVVSNFVAQVCTFSQGLDILGRSGAAKLGSCLFNE